MNNPVEQLQDWYLLQCDGEWEHQYGIKIDTLDNPGWAVKIDLHGTKLANRAFAAVSSERNETDWVRCSVKDRTFEGYGGTRNLSEMISLFLEWAES